MCAIIGQHKLGGDVMSYTIGDIKFDINSHTDELNHNIIDDILVSLPVEEYKLLLTRLHDPHAEARNAPYPYLFQNALKHYNEFAALELPKLSSDYQAIQDKTSAKAHHILQQAYKIQQTKQLMARLQEFSMPFVVLETWMNDQGYNPKATLEQFGIKFEEFESAIKDLIANLKDTYKDNAEISHLINDRLEPRLIENITSFKKQISTLKAKEINLTPQHVRHLLSINRREPGITPLGVLVGECLQITLDMGIKAAKDIQGSRLAEQVGALHGPSELRSAKLAIEIKLSTEGTGHVDTYSKTNSSLIDDMCLKVSTTPIDGVVKVSLLDFCPDLKLSHLVHVIDVIKTVKPQNATQISTEEPRSLSTSIAIGLWVVVAGFIEAGIATAHFALNIALIFPALFLPTLVQQVEQNLSALHDEFSKNIGLKQASMRWNERHLIGKDESYKAMIKECSEPHSYFQEILSTHLSVKAMADLLTTSIISVLHNLMVEPYRFLRYALYETTPEQTFNEVNAYYDSVNLFLSELKKHEPKVESLPSNVVKRRKLNVENHLQIPTAFIGDIITGGSNLLVTPIFYNAPSVAVFCFAISIGGFISYLPPVAAIACLKGLTSILTAPLNAVGMELMGALPTTLMNQAVAALFFWKIGVLTTEALKSVIEGDFEFLAQLIDKPEEFVMFISCVMVLSVGLRMLPMLNPYIFIKGVKIPNLYAIILNIYIAQAHEGSLTSSLAVINYFLLGIQTAILLQTIANVDSVSYPIKDLHQAFQDEKLFDEKDSVQLKNKITTIFNRFNIILSDENINKMVIYVVNLQKNPENANRLISSLSAMNSSSNQLGDVVEQSGEPAKYQDGPNNIRRVDLQQEQNLDDIRTQLIAVCSRLENGLVFTDTKESSARNQALRYYEHLDSLFNHYNSLANTQSNESNPIPFIDKRPFLAVFYRRHCMSTRTVIGRFIAIFPLAPLTYTARLISVLYGLMLNKPSWVRSAAIATADDIIMITDLVFGTIRAIQAFALYVSGVLRMPFATLILPAKAYESLNAECGEKLDEQVFTDVYSPQNPSLNKDSRRVSDRLFEWANNISLHRAYDAAKRIPYFGSMLTYIGGGLSATHANATRSVSTNDDISGAAIALRDHLESVKERLCSSTTIMMNSGVSGNSSTEYVEGRLKSQVKKENPESLDAIPLFVGGDDLEGDVMSFEI